MVDTSKQPDRGKDPSLPLFFAGVGGGLSARDVSVRYDPVEALAGVDLAVDPGSHVALVGPNGSGKSTLLLTLKGVVAPSSGRVTLDGRSLEGIDPRVGLVLANPEDQGVAPIVQDDVAFGLEYLGLLPHEIEKRVEASLTTVGLLELRSAPVHTLSGGQTQKLALASVLALGARFLLLDEATSMLSPWDRDALMMTLGKLRRVGLGVVHVTHQAEELLWADRVVFLETGRVVFDGSVQEFFGRSACPWEKPAYLGLIEDLGRAGLGVPAYSEVVQWIGA